MDSISDIKNRGIMIKIPEIPYEFPTERIDNYKSLWEKLYLNNDMLNWLEPSNEKQCLWVWNYLWEHKDPIGYHDNETEKKYFTISSLQNLLNPINNKELYLSACAIIYYFLGDEFKNNSDLLKRMKKSWLQKLRRTKKPKPKKKVDKKSN